MAGVSYAVGEFRWYTASSNCSFYLKKIELDQLRTKLKDLFVLRSRLMACPTVVADGSQRDIETDCELFAPPKSEFLPTMMPKLCGKSSSVE